MKSIETKTRFNKTVCLKSELDNFMNYIGLDSRMQEMEILKVWSRCVGEGIAKFSAPVEMRKNKLFVRVENAVWRYELSIKKNEIIEKLNLSLKKKLIKDIIFI
jgi:predicted nucleic acid-binding Zn ribbon protein